MLSVRVENRECVSPELMQSYAIINVDHIEVNDFFNDAFPILNDRQSVAINNNSFVRMYAIFIVEFMKDVSNSAGVFSQETLSTHSAIQFMDADTIT